jgi:hypothetical protein
MEVRELKQFTDFFISESLEVLSNSPTEIYPTNRESRGIKARLSAACILPAATQP